MMLVVALAGATMKLFITPKNQKSSERTETNTTQPTDKPQPNQNTDNTTDANPRGLTESPKPGPSNLRYKGKTVILTKHAVCRMDCRALDLQEVQEVLDKGKVNERKSDRQASPCGTLALETRTRDGQMARVVIADCAEQTKIVTVIDLDNDNDGCPSCKF